MIRFSSFLLPYLLFPSFFFAPGPVISRRRLAIAALALLVLGGGLWWWLRPTVDPRLVGTWFRHPKSSGPLIWILHQDGRFKSDGPDFGPDGGFWYVRGDMICTAPPYMSSGPMDLAKEFCARAWHRIQYRRPYGERPFRIVEVGDGRLRIQEPTPIGREPRRVWTYFASVDRAAQESIPKSDHSPLSKDFEIHSADKLFGP